MTIELTEAITVSVGHAPDLLFIICVYCSEFTFQRTPKACGHYSSCRNELKLLETSVVHKAEILLTSIPFIVLFHLLRMYLL